ncbi:hypothetical protein MRB53_025331 [Persea americana]|uniref:Uncharacterized protein n=1 Tax=Persea americana TaxID=3435 RepID=A0ACC2LEW0_PERAE|nr:hypothetical protein MRB53_025331 [Persea americana]
MCQSPETTEPESGYKEPTHLQTTVMFAPWITSPLATSNWKQHCMGGVCSWHLAPRAPFCMGGLGTWHHKSPWCMGGLGTWHHGITSPWLVRSNTPAQETEWKQHS